jgi:DeoR/GlpR family transcriptional regulator of sugar metabolism
MFASKRQQEIYSIIKQKGSAQVANLSKFFHVTKETIRRDLEQMEKQGLIRRTHGGAILNPKEQDVPSFFHREISHLESKQSIAKEAAKLVKHGDIIALDSSDISFLLAKQLAERDIMVITNSIAVTLEFFDKEKVKVITVGGYLNKELSSFNGSITEKAIEGYHVDKYFFSCNGVHLDHGAYENNEMEAQVKHKFMSISDQLILLADHAKFGQKSLTSLIALDKIHALVTDQGLPINTLTSLRGRNLQLFVGQ